MTVKTREGYGCKVVEEEGGANFVDKPLGVAALQYRASRPCRSYLRWALDGLSYKKLVHEHIQMPLSILGRVPLSWCTTAPSPFRASFSVRNCPIRWSLLNSTEKWRPLFGHVAGLG